MKSGLVDTNLGGLFYKKRIAGHHSMPGERGGHGGGTHGPAM
jgi:hypothetical protein